MNHYKAVTVIGDLAPEINKTGDPEGVLVKYASDNNLAPAELERLCQVFNTAKTLTFMKKSAGNRGGSFDILDVPSALERYTTYTPPDSHVKSAAAPTPKHNVYKLPDLRTMLGERETIKVASSDVSTPVFSEHDVKDGLVEILKQAQALEDATDEAIMGEALRDYIDSQTEAAWGVMRKLAFSLCVEPDSYGQLHLASAFRLDGNRVALGHLKNWMETYEPMVPIKEPDAVKMASIKITRDNTGLLDQVDHLNAVLVDISTAQGMLKSAAPGTKKRIGGSTSEGEADAEIDSAIEAGGTDPAGPDDPSGPDDDTAKALRENAAREKADAQIKKRQAELKKRNQEKHWRDQGHKDREDGKRIRETSLKNEAASKLKRDDEAARLAAKEEAERVKAEAKEEAERAKSEAKSLADADAAGHKSYIDYSLGRMADDYAPGVGTVDPAKFKSEDQPEGHFLKDLGQGVDSLAEWADKKTDRPLNWLVEQYMKGPSRNVRQESQDRTIKDMAAAVTLQRAILTDPILAESDPDRVVSLYNSLYTANPDLMSDPNLALYTLREAVQYDGVTPHTYQQLADIENVQAKTRKESEPLEEQKYKI